MSRRANRTGPVARTFEAQRSRDWAGKLHHRGETPATRAARLTALRTHLAPNAVVGASTPHDARLPWHAS